MSKMFREVSRTWSPICGCNYNCKYCWARSLALSRLKHLDRYKDGFTPKLIESELSKRFKSGLVFVSSMGDAFGPWVPRTWIEKVLAVVRESDATFLFLTKNPARYHEFLGSMPPNVILGATIETNRWYRDISYAPNPLLRFEALESIRGFSKMLAIEPIMAFDHRVFVDFISQVSPDFVYIGYDNHHNNLPEPAPEHTDRLIAALREITEVRLKRHLGEG